MGTTHDHFSRKLILMGFIDMILLGSIGFVAAGLGSALAVGLTATVDKLIR